MPKKFNPQDYPVCFSPPLRIAPHYWARHIPFAMFLIDILRPKIFVELGTYYGVSYCAFCQAVKELGLNTRCYAIDTWRGDGITWSYETSEVLEDLKQHHDPLYGSFSRLTQSTFDDARDSFQDGEIDLLHIDGYHPYESVKHDFETWLPKMSKAGVIIFHDINVRQAEYGVWKLWSEITPIYPHFEIWHEHGLGVLAVGTQVPKAFRELLLEQDEASKKEIQNFFFQLGERWMPLFKVQEVEKENQNLRSANQNLHLENQNLQLANQNLQLANQSLRSENLRIESLSAENEAQRMRIDQLQSQLQLIHNSTSFRVASKFQKLVGIIAPPNTYRYRLLIKAKKWFSQ